MQPWTPQIEGRDGPVYTRIVDALADDVARGALAAGARLPTQRTLAERLRLGVGTVTRAYAEAEARGIIEAVVGRGSFVAETLRRAPADQLIDLSRNIAPLEAARGALRQAMAKLARRGDLADRLDYAPKDGFPADRSAGARWLRRAANYAGVDEDELIITAGAQQAIAVALAAICRASEALIVEEATFNGVKLAAHHAGLTLAPAAMDAEGLTPEALLRAAAETGAKAAYVQPFQNPTARVMGAARRRELIDAARQAGVILIEDDLYGPHIAELGLAPLAQLDPYQVAYVSGLSKSLAPGVRTGFLVPPRRYRNQALEALRGMTFGPPTFGALLATHWIETGEAFEILAAAHAELGRRNKVAHAVLGDRFERVRQGAGPHLWLPLPELEAERVVSQALRSGVTIIPPRAPFVDGVPVSGIRICLGAAADLATLEKGLAILNDCLAPARPLAESLV